MANQEQFRAILKQSERMGISCEQLSSLKSVRKIINDGKNWQQRNFQNILLGIWLVLTIIPPSVIVYNIKHETTFGNSILKTFVVLLDESQILTELPCILRSQPLAPYARIPTNCSRCADVTEVMQLRNVSQNDFLTKYAFTMQPIVVKDAQSNWTAGESFSYEYFQSIYSPGSQILEEVARRCLFFPYETGLANLAEFFNMSKNQVEGKEGRWYVGWINCEGKSANQLRKHYQRPYFLSPELDHSKLDWVFMGMPGRGASLHVDFVQSSIWQAQLRGHKKWTLESPPECFGTCVRRLEVTVDPGDIIVLDGNSWFHQTEIVGEDNSIVIGSEYY
uniref:Uncharacterized LOC100186342 n=1 Tax=Ciona intestinalis TaxID=7719 RepID=F6Y549_CIOIN|nr:uncharacterized protein LOC100186342 isoform X1 [Ciona intestinalis]|eukprot:XP_002120936.1 uncharacterized protein LOC100186342 isoform X1 [Ciona intestinalis]